MIKVSKIQANISLTPLIDVVFILLIFFMTTMSLQKIQTVDLQLPKTIGQNEIKPNKKTLVFTVSENGISYKKKMFKDKKNLLNFINAHNKKLRWGIKPNKTISTDAFLKIWQDLINEGLNISIISPKKRVKK